MQIKDYQEKDRERWNHYVEGHEEATLFHTVEFKEIVEATFSFRPYYLLAESGGEVKGILPLFLCKSFLFGDFLISVPYAVYGGICASDEEAETALFEAAGKISQKENVNYMELRNSFPGNLGLPTKNLYAYFRLELSDDPEVIWTGMRKRNRNILRKGIKSGLEIRHAGIGKVDSSSFEEFYHFFARSQRNLGTPVLPVKFFENIFQTLKERVSIISALYKGEVASCMMNYYFKDMALPYYIGYDPRFLKFAVNNFIVWEEIKFCCRAGYKRFDLGRSRVDSGSYSFKKHWGIEPKPLHYQYALHKAAHMPNISPSNPKYDIPRRIWARLPLPVSKLLGPLLIRHLP